MKIRTTFGVWLLVVSIVSVAGMPAVADVRKGDGEIGFDIGGMDIDDKLVTGGGALRVDFRIGYMFSNLFELEGQLGYASPDDGDLAMAFVNGVFNFRTSPRFMPYVLVGGGGARLEVANVSDTGVAGQLAGGFRGFGENGRVGLRLEGGIIVLDQFNETTTQGTFVVGFTFALGDRHVHRPPRVHRKALER